MNAGDESKKESQELSQRRGVWIPEGRGEPRQQNKWRDRANMPQYVGKIMILIGQIKSSKCEGLTRCWPSCRMFLLICACKKTLQWGILLLFHCHVKLVCMHSYTIFFKGQNIRCKPIALCS